MKPRQFIERLIYVIIIVLALIAIALVFLSPPEFVKNKVIYGGF